MNVTSVAVRCGACGCEMCPPAAEMPRLWRCSVAPAVAQFRPCGCVMWSLWLRSVTPAVVNCGA
eukprot:4519482-Pyramimonas_sp.AAC.1